nr:hypothetical protein Iba_chr05dCG1110 [Ipomoea batatas]
MVSSELRILPNTFPFRLFFFFFICSNQFFQFQFCPLRPPATAAPVSSSDPKLPLPKSEETDNWRLSKTPLGDEIFASFSHFSPFSRASASSAFIVNGLAGKRRKDSALEIHI